MNKILTDGSKRRGRSYAVVAPPGVPTSASFNSVDNVVCASEYEDERKRKGAGLNKKYIDCQVQLATRYICFCRFENPQSCYLVRCSKFTSLHGQ